MNKKGFSLGLFIALFMVIGIIWAVVEGMNEELIETENKVPCLDNMNRRFENEMCYEKVRCTNFNFSLSLVINWIEHCDDVIGRKDE